MAKFPSFYRIVGAIAGCAIASALPPVRAETPAPLPTTAPTRLQYTPSTLVDAAYNGRLESEGIPSFADLTDAILLRDLKAEDLVVAAIAQGRLTAATLDDRGFLQAVKANLRSLISDQYRSRSSTPKEKAACDRFCLRSRPRRSRATKKWNVVVLHLRLLRWAPAARPV